MISSSNDEQTAAEQVSFLSAGIKPNKVSWSAYLKALVSMISPKSVAAIAALAMVVLMYVGIVSSTTSSSSSSSSTTTATAAKSVLVSPQILLERVQEQREIMYEDMRQKYGSEHFQNMFLERNSTTVTRGRTAFMSPDPSTESLAWHRMTRKLMIKVLHAMTRSATRQQQTPPTFVWASGGHSAAASHGNFYDQSYTAYMQEAVKGVFEAAGIVFEGRNYAMGGSMSAPEWALCMEATYGTDVDVISWDHGMTENVHKAQMSMFLYRAGLRPNRAAAIMLNGDERPRIDTMAELLQRGMTALYLSQGKRDEMLSFVPDTRGMTTEEIDAMPPFVKNFKCEGAIENGEPFCKNEKFNNTICDKRKYRVSWHPGWKIQASQGMLMALFMVDVLEDAIQEISDSESSPFELLEQLEAEVEADYRKQLDMDLPSLIKEIELPHIDANDLSSTFELLYKEPTICRTAMLPAQSRYKGIMFETDPIEDVWSFESVAHEQRGDVIATIPNDTPNLRLAADMSERQACEVPLNIDHKDFYYLDQKEGAKVITLPNDAELEEYGRGRPLKGILAICFIDCGWTSCPAHTFMGGVDTDQLSVKVNGEPVTTMTQMILSAVYGPCFFLQNKDGLVFAPNEEGRFKIKLKVKNEGDYVKFSSFVVW